MFARSVKQLLSQSFEITSSDAGCKVARYGFEVVGGGGSMSRDEVRIFSAQVVAYVQSLPLSERLAIWLMHANPINRETLAFGLCGSISLRFGPDVARMAVMRWCDRECLRPSQAQIAERAGVDQATISRYCAKEFRVLDEIYRAGLYRVEVRYADELGWIATPKENVKFVA